MISDELRAYIESELSRGFDREAISNIMRRNGYTDGMINEAFDGLYPQPPDATQSVGSDPKPVVAQGKESGKGMDPHVKRILLTMVLPLIVIAGGWLAWSFVGSGQPEGGFDERAGFMEQTAPVIEQAGEVAPGCSISFGLECFNPEVTTDGVGTFSVMNNLTSGVRENVLSLFITMEQPCSPSNVSLLVGEQMEFTCPVSPGAEGEVYEFNLNADYAVYSEVDPVESARSKSSRGTFSALYQEMG